MALFNLLKLRLDTEWSDLASATSTAVIAIPPNSKTPRIWASSSLEGTKIVYNTSPGDIDEYGNWKFQAYAIIAGQEMWGDIVDKEFTKPLYNNPSI